MESWRIQLLISFSRNVRKRAAGVALTLVLSGLGTSCGRVPEHPGDESLVLGFQVTDREVEVKVPICPGEKLARAEVWDPGDDSKKEKLLWWGEGPLGGPADNGVLRLWSSVGYRKSSKARRPSTLPSLIDVSVTYANKDDSVGDLIDLGKAANHGLKDEYWTKKGKPMSAREIDGQLSCGSGR
ncbi:hypothetical protein [Streptomyces sp. LaBMicrA B280]|uniref:hypothetical protein n=1 Tax=Streptomyces sp. LaBMicrA B280 TaxID=3391001 RepID=UPI003BA825E2